MQKDILIGVEEDNNQLQLQHKKSPRRLISQKNQVQSTNSQQLKSILTIRISLNLPQNY